MNLTKSTLSLSLLLLSSLSMADKVDGIITRAMHDLHVPGLTLAVVKDGKPIKMKAYGLANVEFDVPTKTSTPFLLASITKTFTATSIMMLVEEGKVKLDSPISDYLAETPDSWKGITVRHLLSHTGGLRDRFEAVPYNPAVWKLNYTEDEVYAAARKTPVDFPPGERFQYSDQDFALLGMIIEKASGLKYPEFLKKRIFDPLGMTNSSCAPLPVIVKGMSIGYAWYQNKLYHTTRRTTYGIVSHFGMISSAEDLAKWDAALNSGKLLKPSSYEAMWRPSATNNGSFAYTAFGAYGLGWFIEDFNGHKSIAHGGSSGTAYLRYPAEKLTVIVLTNMEQATGGDAPGIATAIAREYVRGIRWSDLKPELAKGQGDTPLIERTFADLAAGKASADDFEAYFLSQLTPTLPQQKAGLSALGPLKRVEFLSDQAWGTGSVSRYKLSFKSAMLYGTLWLNPAGKIAFLEVEQAETYK